LPSQSAEIPAGMARTGRLPQTSYRQTPDVFPRASGMFIGESKLALWEAYGSPPNNATSAPGPARCGTAIRPASRPQSGITEILKAEFTGRIIPSGSMDASGFPLAPERAVRFQTRTDRGSFLNVDGFTPKTRWNARRKLRASAYPILAAIASTGSP